MKYPLLIAIIIFLSYGVLWQNPADVTISVDMDAERQTIHGFGASDAWSVQFVGKNWPEEKRNRMADLLFSTETNAAGEFVGIGLSIWRFNIGGGSAEQGEGSGIRDEWRRAEGFLQDDGSYDWSSQQGQQWFMNAAQERGVDKFVGFVNSPPVQLTKNGRAYGDGRSSANLSEAHYDDFARFLADVAFYFERERIPLSYISPVNEPQWNWSRGNNQEGSPYLNSELAAVVRELDAVFAERGIGAEIEIPEAAQIDFLYDEGPDGRGHQIDYFAGDPETAVTGLPGVAGKVAGHSYFTTWPVADMIRHRKQLGEAMAETGLEFWMSEYCILEDNEEAVGPGRDLGMDPALYMARVMHHDLTLANAASWQWWLGISPYDYNDGLVYIDMDQHGGEVYESKKLWAMGNFSRFVRPGSVRLGTARNDDVSLEEQARGLMISAYSTPEDGLAVVAVNYSADDMTIDLEVNNSQREIEAWIPHITSAGENLQSQNAASTEEPLTVPARSVVTFTGAWSGSNVP